jgi:transcriptional regulator with XRE-family HTH domain
MEKHKISGIELAARLGVRPSYVSQIRTGKRSIAVHALGDWIRALRLSPEEAREFRLLGLLQLSPPEIRGFINVLRLEISQLRQQGQGGIPDSAMVESETGARSPTPRQGIPRTSKKQQR